MDRERGFDSGGQRPVLSAAEEPRGAHPQLHYPADLPLHLREQTHGHHRAGEGRAWGWGDRDTWGDTGLTWAGWGTLTPGTAWEGPRGEPSKPG